MAKIGMTYYSTAVSNSTRTDILAYYTECLRTSLDLYNRSMVVTAQKGILSRAPYYTSIGAAVSFVKKESFVGGIFATKKPLLSFEIAELFANTQRNLLGQALLLGFSQVGSDEEVRKYMVRGKNISQKHITIFTTLLNKENLPVSMTPDYLPTDSITYTYSDKLMMFHTTSLSALGVANYGTSLSVCTRRDLQVTYSRLIIEIGQYAADGAKLMIKNGWLEQPPVATNRKELSRTQS